MQLDRLLGNNSPGLGSQAGEEGAIRGEEMGPRGRLMLTDGFAKTQIGVPRPALRGNASLIKRKGS